MRFLTQIILLTLILSSCMDQKDIKVSELDIQISFKDDLDVSVLDGAEVELKDVNNGRIYNQLVSQGVVNYSIEPGVYRASLSVEIDKVNYNAFLDDIKITEEYAGDKQLILKRGVYSPIIIKEFYYSGVFSKAGSPYYQDQFFEIYNNSSEVQDIGGLCFAEVYGSSSSLSKWVDEMGDLLPYLPVSKMIWSIPEEVGGNFLAPGESRVIAQNAINHSDPDLSHSSVNLENADYETWFEPSGKDYDNRDVDNLDLVWSDKDTYSDWVISLFGSAIILFDIPGDHQAFIKDDSNFHVDSDGNREKLCIPKEYILDAVECVRSEAKNNKRLGPELDASYVFVSEVKKGYSVRRRVKDIINGRVVYMDTNDSARDFLTDQVPMPGSNPSNIEI